MSDFSFSDIVARLAESSSESEFDKIDGSMKVPYEHLVIEENITVNFQDDLQAFQNTAPRSMRNKKTNRKKRKERKDCVDVN